MAEPIPQNILTVENLSISYGTQLAVNDVSFGVQAGEIFGLLGPNGAGKTSTLSAIEGLIKFRQGAINIGGYDISKQPRHAKSLVGIQLQSTSFQPELTVAEIIRLYAGLYGVTLSHEKLQAILEDIKLADAQHKRFGQLSGGQQQRVSLVIATIHQPLLVLLDEPTTGLDPQSRRQLWERMESIRERGHCVLLTTHSMEEAEAVCDRVSIIDHGRIVATGNPQEIIDRYKTDSEVIRVSRRGKVTLEDVFIALTGRTVRA